MWPVRDEGRLFDLGTSARSRPKTSRNYVGGRSCIQNQQHNEIHQALRRIELPEFDGSDPMGWLGKMEQEQYFDLQDTAPSNRLKLVHISMARVTSHWFRG